MNIGKYIQQYSEDLRFKNYAENTIKNYVSQIKSFLEYFNSEATKPSEISEKKIKLWLLKANEINTRKHRLSAVKLFYKLTGKQPLKLQHIEYPKSNKKLPIVLSEQEIQGLFSVCENLKHKTILALLYSTGMRVSEIINLKWEHIDRSRMIINVIQAKGKKDRQVPLPASLIPLLEQYYAIFKPKVFVLNGQIKQQYTATSVNQVLKHLAHKAGIKKHIHAHLIRHCTFTHMVEHGTDINLIQRVAGHNNVKTTAIYTHISHSVISQITSPLQFMQI